MKMMVTQSFPAMSEPEHPRSRRDYVEIQKGELITLHKVELTDASRSIFMDHDSEKWRKEFAIYSIQFSRHLDGSYCFSEMTMGERSDRMKVLDGPAKVLFGS